MAVENRTIRAQTVINYCDIVPFLFLLLFFPLEHYPPTLSRCNYLLLFSNSLRHGSLVASMLSKGGGGGRRIDTCFARAIKIRGRCDCEEDISVFDRSNNSLRPELRNLSALLQCIHRICV